MLCRLPDAHRDLSIVEYQVRHLHFTRTRTLHNVLTERRGNPVDLFSITYIFIGHGCVSLTSSEVGFCTCFWPTMDFRRSTPLAPCHNPGISFAHHRASRSLTLLLALQGSFSLTHIWCMFLVIHPYKAAQVYHIIGRGSFENSRSSFTRWRRFLAHIVCQALTPLPERPGPSIVVHWPMTKWNLRGEELWANGLGCWGYLDCPWSRVTSVLTDGSGHLEAVSSTTLFTWSLNYWRNESDIAAMKFSKAPIIT